MNLLERMKVKKIVVKRRKTTKKVCTAEINSYSFNTNSTDNNYIKYVNIKLYTIM